MAPFRDPPTLLSSPRVVDPGLFKFAPSGDRVILPYPLSASLLIGEAAQKGDGHKAGKVQFKCLVNRNHLIS
ncbi:hypothetical protein DDZ16_05990 [Marinilabilia rubra]|uniref:Uncharacterized protein n=1 Tax=Marinilabilia rubra TaxID=2162893 RepID=A0A2U2BBR8_9BACT|nr:hypothetical protein DDZ16_05990 [Marinilabilia rubra]